MRKLCVFLSVIVLVISVLGLSAQAQAPAPGVWNVGFTMQNLSTTTVAEVIISFVKPDGTSGGQWTGTIAANGSKFLYTGAMTEITTGEYAATISSTTPLVAVANMASSDPKTEAAYSGVSQTGVAPQLFVPGVYKNYYNNVSSVSVQNTGASKTCVRVSFSALGSTAVADTDIYNVPAGATHTFLQASNTALPNNFIGSARVESLGSGTAGCGADTTAGQPLAAIVNISVTPGPSTGNPTNRYLFGSYNAITGGGPVAYVPVLANNYYNNISSLTVLNLRTTAQWVRVTYGTGGAGTVREKQLAANSSALWYTPNEGVPLNWFGGAKVECIAAQGGAVTTNCEIVATVNQINTTGGFASYNGFATGAQAVRLPIVNRRYAPAYGGYTTSVTCQNVSTVTTNISLALTAGSVPAVPNVVPNGKAFWYLNSAAYTGVAVGFNGSATATASNADARIVCIGQQNGETPPTVGDWLTTYNGLME
jgi:hypothetical protein